MTFYLTDFGAARVGHAFCRVKLISSVLRNRLTGSHFHDDDNGERCPGPPGNSISPWQVSITSGPEGGTGW